MNNRGQDFFEHQRRDVDLLSGDSLKGALKAGKCSSVIGLYEARFKAYFNKDLGSIALE